MTTEIFDRVFRENLLRSEAVPLLVGRMRDWGCAATSEKWGFGHGAKIITMKIIVSDRLTTMAHEPRLSFRCTNFPTNLNGRRPFNQSVNLRVCSKGSRQEKNQLVFKGHFCWCSVFKWQLKYLALGLPGFGAPKVPIRSNPPVHLLYYCRSWGRNASDLSGTRAIAGLLVVIFEFHKEISFRIPQLITSNGHL